MHGIDDLPELQLQAAAIKLERLVLRHVTDAGDRAGGPSGLAEEDTMDESAMGERARLAYELALIDRWERQGFDSAILFVGGEEQKGITLDEAREIARQLWG